MEKVLNYINGVLQEPASKQYIDNYEPATGKVYSLVPDSDAQDVELAVIAARAAFPEWSKTGLEERMMIMLKIADHQRPHDARRPLGRILRLQPLHARGGHRRALNRRRSGGCR